MEFYKDIKSKYTNKNTICTKITEKLSEFKNLQVLNEEQNEQQKYLRKVLWDLKIEPDEKFPFREELKLEKLRSIWKNFDTNDKYKLITGLYLWIPALRSDFTNADIINNKQIVIKNFTKVNCDKGAVIDIPIELSLLIAYFSLLPKNNSSAFLKLLRKASETIFGEKFGVDIYRRSWVEFGARLYNGKQIKKLAADMNHSLAIHNSMYMPKMEIVYQ